MEVLSLMKNMDLFLLLLRRIGILFESNVHELQKMEDDLSEHLRLVYVALTRARLANVMVFSNSITMKSRLYYSTRLQPKSFEDFGARASHSFMRLQHGDYVIRYLIR